MRVLPSDLVLFALCLPLPEGATGVSPSGKALDFGSSQRRFRARGRVRPSAENPPTSAKRQRLSATYGVQVAKSA